MAAAAAEGARAELTAELLAREVERRRNFAIVREGCVVGSSTLEAEGMMSTGWEQLSLTHDPTITRRRLALSVMHSISFAVPANRLHDSAIVRGVAQATRSRGAGEALEGVLLLGALSSLTILTRMPRAVQICLLRDPPLVP